MAKAKSVSSKPAKGLKKVTPKAPAASKSIPKSKATAQSEFLTVRFTEQSLYWLIFGTAAILFAIWVYTLDARVRDLYDQIDASNNSSYMLEPVKNPAERTPEE